MEKNLLDVERRNSSFNIRKLTYILDGNEEKTKRKEYLCSLMENDPNFFKEDRYFLSKKELYERGLKLSYYLIQKVKKMKISLESEDFKILLNCIGEILPIRLHYSMFVPTLRNQCDEEQKKYWLPLAENFQIIGTYAQTELGHGTFLRGLETTAIYDKLTREFILNSPTLTSMKFWPGGLGKTSTHCILMARLIIDGKNFGPHNFIVQLRSLEDHKPLPGITVGDIGPKFGFHLIDNGYLKLNNVRIPLNQMLMRFAKVTSDGNYIKPPHSKLTYSTLIHARINMFWDASQNLARACTIATRYSAVRRQGIILSKDEIKILDYTFQQYRIFPLIASCYAIHFTAVEMKKLYDILLDSFKNKDFSLLPEIHAICSSLKAICTTLASNGIEECRKTCGGHGYSQFSGIPWIFINYVPSCTFEGDNAVLLQQTARYLLKSIEKVKNGKKLQGSVKYLENFHQINNEKFNIKDKKDLLNNKLQLNAFEHRAIRLIVDVSKLMQKNIKKGKKFEEAWNLEMVDLIRAANAHGYVILLKNFINSISNIQDIEIQKILKSLCDLFALYHIEKDFIEFVEDGYMSSIQVQMVRKQVRDLLSIIRCNAVPLVDAFNFSDKLLHSALGRYDGNVYNALFEMTQNEPLNQSEIAEGYKQYLQPLIKANL